ncbi:hypothetical protein [Erwinia sorbitola]|uniref:MarR family transcriptional regulator n=1 Tax=Erwinia sorbitola TaxID=2681984 RepID=A0A6I6EZH9_9GAMM|nr:hypothetical protein [Erwinia sorbitola]QGU87060.1 hypothetical protein GN242_07460 [Erwinia sorbitola]
MSKVRIAIINFLKDNNSWSSSGDIAKAISYKASSVRISLTSMYRNGLVIRREKPESQGGFLYRKSDVPSGFGVSGKISEFDRCIRGVRA